MLWLCVYNENWDWEIALDSWRIVYTIWITSFKYVRRRTALFFRGREIDINFTILHTTCPNHNPKRHSRQRLTGQDLQQRRQLRQHRENVE